MKEAAILVVVVVVLVGGVAIWVANGNSIPFFSSQPFSVQPASDGQPAQPGTETAKETAPPKPVKARATAKKSPTPPVAEAELEPQLIAPVAEVVVAPPVPPPAPKQFPSAKEIRVGAERENIAEKFGQPALSTTTTGDDGQVKETLVYARKSGRDVTVIRIEDGKVLSAYSR
jgi:hypothetical protein